RFAGHQLPSCHLHSGLQSFGWFAVCVCRGRAAPTNPSSASAPMNLQRYEQVSQAEDLTSFRQGLIDFANDLDFGLVVGVLAIEHRGPGAKTEYVAVGNTPEAF